MGRLRAAAMIAAAAAILASGVLPSRAAWAQRSDEAADEDADARARRLYVQGDKAYAAGDYERSASLFSRAYELSGRPALLFNLGNAYERMGAYGRAADALRRYVDRADVADREVIEQRIARLEEAHRRRQEEIARLEAAEREEGAPDEEFARQSDPAARRRAYLWLGGGGAAVASGLVFGLVSYASGRQAGNRCSDAGGQRLCPDSARSALSRERGFAIAADVTTAIGLGAAAVGGYMLWRQRGEPERAVAIEPTLLPDAIGVGVRGGF